jgi:hypothetical protein
MSIETTRLYFQNIENTNTSFQFQHDEKVLISKTALSIDHQTVIEKQGDNNITVQGVVFTPEGMFFCESDVEGLFFGTNKDFLISSMGTAFCIKAFNSITGDYQTVFELGEN